MNDTTSAVESSIVYGVCLILTVLFIYLSARKEGKAPNPGDVLHVLLESAAVCGLGKVLFKLLTGEFNALLTQDERLCLLLGSAVAIYVLSVRVIALFPKAP